VAWVSGPEKLDVDSMLALLLLGMLPLRLHRGMRGAWLSLAVARSGGQTKRLCRDRGAVSLSLEGKHIVI